MIDCPKHGLTRTIRNGARERCGKCAYEAVKRRRIVIKKKAIEYKGGACAECGYNKCPAALDFHHLDPSKKDYRIGVKPNIAWEKIKRELDKCILLCANCHRELHWSENKLIM